MGVITDILKGIPLNSVLREQLSVLEKKITMLENKVAVLEPENAELKAKLQKIESAKAVHGDICPYCQQPKGKLLDIQPHHTFGDLGVKVHYYQCEDCGKKYDREQSLY
jgi:hypothetical protein